MNIAISITDKTELEKIEHAKSLGLTHIELRADLCEDQSPKSLGALLQKIDLPKILTVRTKEEGGNWQKTESERLTLFESLIPYADYIDIESTAKEIKHQVIAAAKTAKKKLIISQHNFKKTPELEDLESLIKTIQKDTPNYIKIATIINTDDDIKTLEQLLKAHNNLILIGMGEKGVPSRINFPKQGSYLTFAHIGASTAPGQLPIAKLRSLLQA